MKRFILLIIISFFISGVTAQNNKERTVLGYIIGVDSVKSIINKMDVPSHMEFNGVDQYNINFNEFSFKISTYEQIHLLLVNDTLYSVRYYPNLYNPNHVAKKKWWEFKENTNIAFSIDSHMKVLDNKYKIVFYRQEWENDFLIIYYIIDKNGKEYFIYYDKELFERYPQFKKY